jgi:hypothetical protein
MKNKFKLKSKHEHISQNKFSKAKNMNIKCAKQKSKQIFIRIKYESIDIIGTKQSYVHPLMNGWMDEIYMSIASIL